MRLFTNPILRCVGTAANGLQFRIDILNVGNMLDKNYAVLTDHTHNASANLSDVYRFQVSMRYNVQ